MAPEASFRIPLLLRSQREEQSKEQSCLHEIKFALNEKEKLKD